MKNKTKSILLFNGLKNGHLFAFFICIFCFGFWTCKDEIDVTASWKSIPVVFGILNATDDSTFIRINKAYLNQNAQDAQFANNPDSLFFDSLNVVIEEFLNGNFTGNKVNLQKINAKQWGIFKDSGAFAYQNHYLYYTDFPFKESIFRETYSYRLSINVINKNGKAEKYSAITKSVGTINSTSPRFDRPPVFLNISDEGDFRILFSEAFHATTYDLIIKMKYEEFLKNKPQEKELKSLSYTGQSGVQGNPKGGDINALSFPGAAYYNFLESSINANSNTKREIISFDVIIVGGDEQLSTYIEVSKPSIGIVQKKPDYTNVEGGRGIFGSKFERRYKNIAVNPDMLTRLRKNEKTAKLNF
ncbi:MAG: hypothetical protein VXX63_05460 [Bacteroidota bacterium]|nr:hypothetical protein [Bacteroidota bacterium]